MSEESNLRQLTERAKRYQARSVRSGGSTSSLGESDTENQSNNPSDDLEEVFVEPNTSTSDSLDLRREEKLGPNLKLYLPEKPFRSRSGSPSLKNRRASLLRNSLSSSSDNTNSEQQFKSPFVQNINRMVSELTNQNRDLKQYIGTLPINNETIVETVASNTINQEQTRPELNSLHIQQGTAASVKMTNPNVGDENNSTPTVTNASGGGNGSNDTLGSQGGGNGSNVTLNTTHGSRTRTIIDLKSIPYFDGTGHVARFINIADSVMSHIVDEDEKVLWLEAIKTKLDASAYDLAKDIEDWDELKVELRDRFMPVQTVEEVEAKISNIRFLRNIESIEEYLDRITKLGRTYAEVLRRSHNISLDTAKGIADFKIIRYFVEGLDDPIRTTIRGMDIGYCYGFKFPNLCPICLFCSKIINNKLFT